MVTVILRGGLGNQMFQYAAGLDLALKKNTELVLDTTFLNDRFPRRDFTHRTFALDIFDLPDAPRFTTFSKLSSAVPIPGFWLGLDLAWHSVRKIFDGEKNPVLWGFYQGEKYFVDHSEAIRAVFRFRHQPTGEAAALAEKIRGSNSVSIHVRRGDYAQYSSVERMMGATNPAYYEKAIDYISARVTDPHFFIFSDDIEWCKKNIKAPANSMYIDPSSEGPNASFHLQLMSISKHNIVANSTFSWWGAWLNQNTKKIVVVPEHWQEGIDSVDIAPASWIKMSA